jgi:hypothetical protein
MEEFLFQGPFTPDALVATCGVTDRINREALVTMPLPPAGKVDLIFVRFERNMSVRQLQLELQRLHLTLANPYVAMAWNAANPSFVRDYTNHTQWSGKNGKTCSVTFVMDSEPLLQIQFVTEDTPKDFWYVCVSSDGS